MRGAVSPQCRAPPPQQARCAHTLHEVKDAQFTLLLVHSEYEVERRVVPVHEPHVLAPARDAAAGPPQPARPPQRLPRTRLPPSRKLHTESDRFESIAKISRTIVWASELVCRGAYHAQSARGGRPRARGERARAAALGNKDREKAAYHAVVALQQSWLAVIVDNEDALDHGDGAGAV